MGFSKRIGGAVKRKIDRSFKGKRREGLIGFSTISESPTTRNAPATRRTSSSTPPRTASSGGQSRDRKNPDIVEWALARGFKVAYDAMGKPLLNEFIIDGYMATFGNAERYTRPDGTMGYRDKTTGDEVERGTAAAARASSAAASAGISSLFNSYLKDGEISDKDFYSAGTSAGMAGAKTYVDTNFDLEPGSWGGAGSSAAFAGAGSIAQDLISGDGVDWTDAGFDAGSAGLQSLASGTGLGGMAAMAVEIGRSEITGKDITAQKMLGSVGSAVGGPIAGMVGSYIGAQFDKPTEHFIAVYKHKDKPAMYWENGQLVMNPIVDVRRVYNNVTDHPGLKEVSFASATQKKARYDEKVAEHRELQAKWNTAIADYDNLDFGTQMQIDRMRDGDALPAMILQAVGASALVTYREDPEPESKP